MRQIVLRESDQWFDVKTFSKRIPANGCDDRRTGDVWMNRGMKRLSFRNQWSIDCEIFDAFSRRQSNCARLLAGCQWRPDELVPVSLRSVASFSRVYVATHSPTYTRAHSFARSPFKILMVRKETRARIRASRAILSKTLRVFPHNYQHLRS